MIYCGKTFFVIAHEDGVVNLFKVMGTQGFPSFERRLNIKSDIITGFSSTRSETHVLIFTQYHRICEEEEDNPAKFYLIQSVSVVGINSPTCFDIIFDQKEFQTLELLEIEMAKPAEDTSQ
jgi:hypothetical protein